MYCQVTKMPDSIQLKLFKVESTGGKTLVQVDGNDTVTMTKTRSWKYTFTNLDPTAHYVVEEASVSGYTVSYSYPEGSSDVAPGGTVTITNTEAPTYELPSTGSPGRHGSLHGRRRGHCAGRGAVWDITPGASGKGGKSDSCSSDPGNKPNVGK